jgi:hypothetical protein
MSAAEIEPAAVGGGRLAGLAGAVDALAARRIDELTDEDIRAEIAAIEVAGRRLEARSCRLAGALSDRRARRAAAAHPRDARAAERAAGEVRRELAHQLNWTPGQAKQATQDAKKLDSLPAAGAAADAGELSARHARLVADTLAHLLPGEERDRLEAELVDAARTQDLVEFGRTCRRRLAEVDHDAAMADQNRRHARRRAALTHTDDGLTRLWGDWAGLDGETVATAVHAFRRPDRPDEHRTPEQRTADAVVDALAAALRADQAPTTHGVRPHVTVVVDADTVRARAGAADTTWGGPLPYGEIRRLLDDAGISWLAVDGDGLPVEAGPEVRTVPAGLWRALVHRDRGCIAEGCDAPPAWSDVMHLATPHRRGGRLSVETAGLGCRYHHRRYDQNGWQVTWIQGRPTLHPPRPRDGPAP